MKKFFIAVIVILLLLAGGVFLFLKEVKSYVHSDSFIHDLEQYMSEVMAVPVEIEKIELVDMSTATMVGFEIPLSTTTAPPKPVTDGDKPIPTAVPVLIEAGDSTVVFDGIPKMSGNNTMKHLKINQPVVWLEQEEDGSLAWPPFVSKLPAGQEPPSIDLKEVTITDASVSITGKDGFTQLQMNGADVTGSFTAKRGVLTGKGNLVAKKVVLGGKIEITDFKSPVEMSAEAMKLTSFTGKIYGGDIKGKMTVTPKPKSQPMNLNFQANGVDSGKFMEAMGLGSALKIGKVMLDFQGEGELLEPLLIKGEFDFKTSEFDSTGVPVIARMQKMAEDLNLADVKFQALLGEAATDKGVVTFNRITSLPKDASRMDAHGTVDLKGNVNLEGELTLEGGVVGSVQKFFKEAGFMSKDGSLVKKPFKVTGNAADPKVDM